MANSKGVFLEGNLFRHVSVMSFTTSIGLMAMFAVDLVDMMFISMLGKDALAAAVGYAGTLLFFTNAINIGLSIAAGTLVARAIGEEKADTAREYATSVAMFAVITGIMVPLVIWMFLPQIMAGFGAEGEAKRLAVRYVRFILPTMSLMGLAMAGMAVIRANGDARRAMLVTLLGGAVNAVLDPIFIFGFGWDLDGAAIASVLARVSMCALAVGFAQRRYHAFTRPSLEMAKRDMRAVSQIAAPAVLTNVATPVGNAIITREISKFGVDAVAGMAVIGRIIPVAFAVVLALSGAIGPIVGQNFGAKNYDRVRRAFLDGLAFNAIYVCIATVVLFALREPLANMFDATGLARELIYLFCGWLALSYVFNGGIFVCNACFNNLGHPIYSTWINWGRNTVGTLPFVLWGASLMGAKGVLIGQAVGGALFFAIAIALAWRLINSLEKPVKRQPFTRAGRLHTLFGQGRW